MCYYKCNIYSDLCISVYIFLFIMFLNSKSRKEYIGFHYSVFFCLDIITDEDIWARGLFYSGHKIFEHVSNFIRRRLQKYEFM